MSGVEEVGGIFHGFPREQLDRLLSTSNVIECRRGDEVIRRGAVDRTIFVVLDGSVEVRKNGRVVAVMSRGEVVGELAYLLRGERLANVHAITDDVRVLTLSESTLRDLSLREPAVAALRYENLAKIVARRIVSLHEWTFASAS